LIRLLHWLKLTQTRSTRRP